MFYVDNTVGCGRNRLSGILMILSQFFSAHEIFVAKSSLSLFCCF